MPVLENVSMVIPVFQLLESTEICVSFFFVNHINFTLILCSCLKALRHHTRHWFFLPSQREATLTCMRFSSRHTFSTDSPGKNNICISFSETLLACTFFCP